MTARGASEAPEGIRAHPRKHPDSRVAAGTSAPTFARVTRRARARITLHIAALAAACACRSPASLLPIPQLLAKVAYERREVASTRAPATLLEARWFAVTEAPAGAAVAEVAAAIVRERGAPFRGRSSLPVGCRWLRDEEVQEWLAATGGDPELRQLVGHAEAVLAPSLATVLPAARAPLPAVRFCLSAAADGGTEVTLEHALPEGGGREALRIRHGFGPTTTAALFVPCEDLGDGGLVMAFTPIGPAAPDQVGAARAAAELGAPAPATPMSPRALAWQVARDAIGARNRRPSLLALVTPFQQARAVDVLVVADERALAAVTQTMTAVDPDGPDAGWQLERAMWRGLLPRIERHALTPALRAAVTRHLGALPEDPAALALLLETATDGSAFAQRVREENVVALDDRSASLRATAFTFLQSLGVDVPGYDPMAAPAQRRAAVRRHLRSLGAPK